MQPLLYFLIEMYVLGWWSDLCLAVSTSSVVTVAASSATTSGQTFHIAAAAGSMAGSVIAAKLPVPANSKIVTVNVPTTQGGTAGLQHHWHVFFFFFKLGLPARREAKYQLSIYKKHIFYFFYFVCNDEQHIVSMGQLIQPVSCLKWCSDWQHFAAMEQSKVI